MHDVAAIAIAKTRGVFGALALLPGESVRSLDAYQHHHELLQVRIRQQRRS